MSGFDRGKGRYSLRDYGMYIRRTKEGHYNLGFLHGAQRGGLKSYPTCEEAYNVFESLVDNFWGNYYESFMNHVEWELFPKTPLRKQREAAEALKDLATRR